VLGPEFESSRLVFQILTWNLLVIGVTGVYTQLALNMNGQQRRTLIVVAAGAVVSVVLDLILIPSFSYVGAAAAWVSAQSVLCVLAYWMARKYVSVPFWAPFLKAFVASGLMALVCYVLVQWQVGVLLIIPAGAAVYGLGLVATGGLNAQDVELGKQILVSALGGRGRQTRG
jgi:O-antigen/teichoic acid export membrane protein